MFFCEPHSGVKLSSGIGRQWPESRGVFIAKSEKLVVWVNEENHLSMFALEPNGDLQAAFRRFSSSMGRVEEALGGAGYKFAFSDQLGYLTSCPSNIGTAPEMSVHLRLPCLSKQADFHNICKRLGLQATGARGNGRSKDLPAAGEAWEMSVYDRVSRTDTEVANVLVHSCRQLVDMELSLEAGIGAKLPQQSVFAILPGLGDAPFPGFPVDHCPAVLPHLSTNRSLAGEVLRSDDSIFARLKDQVTSKGVSFALCIKPGMDNHNAQCIGAVAGDEDSYEVFRDFFNPLIRRLHGTRPPGALHPYDVSPTMVRGNAIDPSGKHVVAVRVESSRNIRGLCFSPACSRHQRAEVERLLVGALNGLQSSALAGEYFAFPRSNTGFQKASGSHEQNMAELQKYNFSFPEPNSLVSLSSGFGRCWPEARGVYMARSRMFAARINEEDHLHAISIQKGGDIQAAFGRFALAMESLEQALGAKNCCFARSARHGYLTACPGNLGGGLRASVLLYLPTISQLHTFQSTCKNLGLNVRTGHASQFGETHRAGLFEVTNSVHFGFTDAEVVNSIVDACSQLVSMEAQVSALPEVLPVGSGQRVARSLRSTGPLFGSRPKEVLENEYIRKVERISDAAHSQAGSPTAVRQHFQQREDLLESARRRLNGEIGAQQRPRSASGRRQPRPRQNADVFRSTR
jgi:creatine kinase